LAVWTGPRTGLLLAGVAVLGGLCAQPAGAATSWGFEEGAGEWQALGCRIERTKLKAESGSCSLAVKRRFPGCATILRRVRADETLDVNKTPRLSYHVFAPTSAGPALKTLFFLKNKDGLWYQCVRHLPLYPGRWTEVTFDLSPTSSQAEPIGHFRRWSNRAAAEIETIGIKLFAERGFEDRVFVDEISFAQAERAEGGDDETLRILNFRPGAAAVPRFGKFELTFNLNRSFANPFDPDVVTVDATFRRVKDEDGRRVSDQPTEIPGFYCQDFVRAGSVIERSMAKKPDPMIPPRVMANEPRNEKGLIVTKWRDLEDFVPVGGGCWKVRFAPTRLGTYEYGLTVVDRSRRRPRELSTAKRTFTCAASENKGYVRVAKDGRHFEFSSGEPYYPIGHNVHSSNDVSGRNRWLLKPKGRSLMHPQDDRGTRAYESVFAKMAAHGENLAEVWMASWSLDIEWTSAWRNYFGLGRYNLHHAWKLDRILSIAEKRGIYLHLVLDNHGKLSTRWDAEWDENPFNERNGGFLDDPRQYFSRLDAREWYKEKLRYIIARWGYSTQIMGFELWSELDLVGKKAEPPPARMRHLDADDPDRQFLEQKVAWHRDVARYIKRIDHGRHLLTTHYSGTWEKVQPEIARLPGIDYLALDAYRDFRGQGSIVTLLKRTADELAVYGKPVLVTEYGGTAGGGELPQMEADLHAGIWSAYMMQHGGTPLLWWFMYIDRKDKYAHYQALANFAHGEDRRNRDLKTIEPDILGASGGRSKQVSCLALRNDQSAYLWVYDTNSALRVPEKPYRHSGLSVTLDGFSPGEYTIEFWNTYSGKMGKRVSRRPQTGQLTLRLPAFRNDIAVKVKPVERRARSWD